METNITELTTGKGKFLAVKVPEDARGIRLHSDTCIIDFEHGAYYYSQISLDKGRYYYIGLIKDLTEEQWREVIGTMYICFVCGGDGKETCTNPDHGFLTGVMSVFGANESRCPVCGHDPNHKVKNGGICECCIGAGMLSDWQVGEEVSKYGYDDDLVEANYTQLGKSLCEANKVYTENPYGEKEPEDIEHLGAFTQQQRQKHKLWKEAQERVGNYALIKVIQ